jgi:hypothetical protein
MKSYSGLKGFEKFKKDFPESGQELNDIVLGTQFKIIGFQSNIVVESTLAIHTLVIAHDPEKEREGEYNQDQYTIEKRLHPDEGNPRPSIIWYFGDGIITFTGYF